MKITGIEADGTVTLIYSETLRTLKEIGLTLESLNKIRFEIIKVTFHTYFEEN